MKFSSQSAWLAPPFDSEETARIRRAITEGWPMAYPTETAYALGGNALLPDVAEQVYRLKARPANKALLVLVNGIDGAERLAADVSPAVRRLMTACWPGALTLVLRVADHLPPHLSDDRGTLAMRWSPDPVVEELLRIGGVPLIGTSANLSGQDAAHAAADVLRVFGEQVRLGIDGGMRAEGSPSTVLDTTVVPFHVVRAGVVSDDEIRQALGEEKGLLFP